MARVTLIFQDQPDGKMLIESDTPFENLIEREANQDLTIAEGAALHAFRSVVGAIQTRAAELMAQKDAATVH